MPLPLLLSPTKLRVRWYGASQIANTAPWPTIAPSSSDLSKAAEKAELRFVQNSPKEEPEDFIEYLRSLDKKDRDSAIDEKIAESSDDIINDETFASEMATTNACGWSVDDYHVDSIDIETDPIEVRLSYHAAGDQLEDKMYCGTEIRGEAVALIDRDGSVEFTSVSATKDDEQDDADE